MERTGRFVPRILSHCCSGAGVTQPWGVHRIVTRHGAAEVPGATFAVRGRARPSLSATDVAGSSSNQRFDRIRWLPSGQWPLFCEKSNTQTGRDWMIERCAGATYAPAEYSTASGVRRQRWRDAAPGLGRALFITARVAMRRMLGRIVAVSRARWCRRPRVPSVDVPSAQVGPLCWSESMPLSADALPNRCEDCLRTIALPDRSVRHRADAAGCARPGGAATSPGSGRVECQRVQGSACGRADRATGGTHPSP